MIITPVVVGLIFLLLLFTFNSVWLAALVLINLPFAMVGGVFALFLSGLYLSVPASVGLHRPVRRRGPERRRAGVHISDLRDSGAGDAVTPSPTGCETRLRPVLMTASIAIFSLIPMVFATGPGIRGAAPAGRRRDRRAGHLDRPDPARAAGALQWFEGRAAARG